MSRYLQPAQDKQKEMHKEEREALLKKHEENTQWLKDMCNVKDDDRRAAIAQSKALQEKLNKQ